MPGGLLNLVAYGNQNVILNGNPSKTFFKATYAKYTNFGLQKFRIDFSGQRTLKLTESSVFDFTVPRYGDLLMDTYLVVNMPNIWSPVYPPTIPLPPPNEPALDHNKTWQPYRFEWIKNLGTQMIERVRFTIGGQVIQDFTGQYLLNLVNRDFSAEKLQLYKNMTTVQSPWEVHYENKESLYGDAFYAGSNLTVPDNEYIYNQVGSEPTIRAKQIYIPLNIWFTLAAKMAIPLVSLQYAELKIEVTLRPIQELFTIKRVYTGKETIADNLRDRIQPNFNESQYGLYRFLQSPPAVNINDDAVYVNRQTTWNADVHLLSTYGFLTDDEVRIFSGNEQRYIVKQAYTTRFHDVVGSRKVDVNSIGMVSNYMWFFQRSDVNERNQWSNYTNWPYGYAPQAPVSAEDQKIVTPWIPASSSLVSSNKLPPSSQTTSGFYTPENQKLIMNSWALLLDGKYRENEFPAGVFDYVEKYVRTSGNAPEGLYCYNFALHSDPFDFQPSGAINMSKFTNVQFEVVTNLPVLDSGAQFNAICGVNPTTGESEVIGVSKPAFGIYKYTYDLVVMEERWNVVIFSNGMASLQFSR
ncbi:MAG: hypothetical protein CMI79_05390 [Candidatus Pelagibacter sp.]|nr:hypothetical protein [Candidatus Pelagibacter sp.]|tara:strand:- start:3643 stop:5385 length:1743 start_codon:yes stop_codon:yes gene_type:complete